MGEGAPVMLWVVTAFLGLSLLCYCLFGGADFGAGILEIFFLGRKDRWGERNVIDRALGPVWEANHIWLILMVVILFMGFPAVYGRVSVSLHIPLTAMLMGVIARGCSFTFRHYDAVKGKSQKLYTAFFVFSSLWTPFCLGVVTGALVPGGIAATLDPQGGYYVGYVAPWLRPFPLALGVFTDALFALLAAVYLVGESPVGDVRRSFARLTRYAGLAAIAAGAFVFLAARADGVALDAHFLRMGFSAACMALATLALPAMAWALAREKVWTLRVLAGLQVALILAGWLRVQFPVLVRLSDGSALTFFNAHAPAPALFQLGIALLSGSALILPALFYLLRVFKSEAVNTPRSSSQ
jgi:cytochrome d ubiquinol oxidase subunit II